jgi:hypothetical protein
VVLVDHMTDQYSVFKEATILFSKVVIVAHQQYMNVPFSLHSCQHLLLVFLLIAALIRKVESQCGFDLHFLMTRDGKHFFICFFDHLDFFFRKSFVKFSCPQLYWFINLRGV